MEKKYTRGEIAQLFEQPFFDLVHQAHTVHQNRADNNQMQLSILQNIKMGACPEDCKFCHQSVHFKTNLERTGLVDTNEILAAAKVAREKGATRFCMAAAWRGLQDRHLGQLGSAVTEIKKMGLETCLSLGFLTKQQAEKLKEYGLDYYNHNIETSENHFKNVVSTHKHQDRLDTVETVRNAGIKVCCGGILGIGETKQDHIDFLHSLANLKQAPESLPLNILIPFKNIPLENAPKFDAFNFIRVVAVARIIMPNTTLRLSGGRLNTSEEFQAWCFYAGISSIHGGGRYLTSDSPSLQHDHDLLQKLNLSNTSLEEEHA